MTADQFQREVVDILVPTNEGMSDKILREVKWATIKRFYGLSTEADTESKMLAYNAIVAALSADLCGYSLDVIFLLALDELEKEYKA